ncbi:hypothetical protein B0H14DRAFT_2575125 [Mycena olivaceomarginata]|nr:hypothetical protein B0H14DRAFT_2575125 [Mycena olivaceomarginata]
MSGRPIFGNFWCVLAGKLAVDRLLVEIAKISGNREKLVGYPTSVAFQGTLPRLRSLIAESDRAVGAWGTAEIDGSPSSAPCRSAEPLGCPPLEVLVPILVLSLGWMLFQMEPSDGTEIEAETKISLRFQLESNANLMGKGILPRSAAGRMQAAGFSSSQQQGSQRQLAAVSGSQTQLNILQRHLAALSSGKIGTLQRQYQLYSGNVIRPRHFSTQALKVGHGYNRGYRKVNPHPYPPNPYPARVGYKTRSSQSVAYPFEGA